MAVKQRKLNAKERTYMREIHAEFIELRDDWHRRLLNALKALRSMDPDWRAWCKCELHKGMSISIMAQKVEQRASKLVLKSYQYLHIRNDAKFMFNDHGNMVER